MEYTSTKKSDDMCASNPGLSLEVLLFETCLSLNTHTYTKTETTNKSSLLGLVL